MFPLTLLLTRNYAHQYGSHLRNYNIFFQWKIIESLKGIRCNICLTSLKVLNEQVSPEAHLEQHNHKILLLWIYQKAAACDKSIQCTHSEAETSKYEIT